MCPAIVALRGTGPSSPQALQHFACRPLLPSPLIHENYVDTPPPAPPSRIRLIIRLSNHGRESPLFLSPPPLRGCALTETDAEADTMAMREMRRRLPFGGGGGSFFFFFPFFWGYRVGRGFISPIPTKLGFQTLNAYIGKENEYNETHPKWASLSRIGPDRTDQAVLTYLTVKRRCCLTLPYYNPVNHHRYFPYVPRCHRFPTKKCHPLTPS